MGTAQLTEACGNAIDALEAARLRFQAARVLRSTASMMKPRYFLEAWRMRWQARKEEKEAQLMIAIAYRSLAR